MLVLPHYISGLGGIRFSRRARGERAASRRGRWREDRLRGTAATLGRHHFHDLLFSVPDGSPVADGDAGAVGGIVGLCREGRGIHWLARPPFARERCSPSCCRWQFPFGDMNCCVRCGNAAVKWENPPISERSISCGLRSETCIFLIGRSYIWKLPANCSTPRGQFTTAKCKHASP